MTSCSNHWMSKQFRGNKFDDEFHFRREKTVKKNSDQYYFKKFTCSCHELISCHCECSSMHCQSKRGADSSKLDRLAASAQAVCIKTRLRLHCCTSLVWLTSCRWNSFDGRSLTSTCNTAFAVDGCMHGKHSVVLLLI